MKQEIASMAQGLQAWHMIWGNEQPGTGAGGQYRSGQISASPSEELASFTPVLRLRSLLSWRRLCRMRIAFPWRGPLFIKGHIVHRVLWPRRACRIAARSLVADIVGVAG